MGLTDLTRGWPYGVFMQPGVADHTELFHCERSALYGYAVQAVRC